MLMQLRNTNWISDKRRRFSLPFKGMVAVMCENAMPDGSCQVKKNQKILEKLGLSHINFFKTCTKNTHKKYTQRLNLMLIGFFL